MRELVINNATVRIFENNLVKIYTDSKEEADMIWSYLLKEALVE